MTGRFGHDEWALETIAESLQVLIDTNSKEEWVAEIYKDAQNHCYRLFELLGEIDKFICNETEEEDLAWAYAKYIGEVK